MLELEGSKLVDTKPSMLYLEVSKTDQFQLQLRFMKCEPLQYNSQRTYPLPSIYSIDVAEGSCAQQGMSMNYIFFLDSRVILCE